MKKWTLEAKRIGKLKDVSISINSIMFFAGENSTGKTYLLNLLYYFYNYKFSYGIAQNLLSSNNVLKEKIFNRVLQKETFVLDAETINILLEEVSRFVTKDLKRIKKEVFNSNVLIQNLKIIFDHFSDDINIVYQDDKDYSKLSAASASVGVSPQGINYWFTEPKTDNLDNEKETRDIIFSRYSSVRMIFGYILDVIIEKYIGFSNSTRIAPRSNSIYLPAGRSAFLMMNKFITQKAFNVLTDFELDRDVGEMQLKTNYGVRTFLNNIVSNSLQNFNHFENITSKIERDILKGSFIYNEIDNEYQFRPYDSKRVFKIWSMSSSVSEIGAFIESLRKLKSNTGNLIVYEEPESHLHPNRQIKLMENIIEYCRMGNHIWISTHSDFIVQFVNNKIKEKYLNKDSGIEEKNVSVYIFENEKTVSYIKEVKSSKFGYKIEGFIEFLKSMMKQTNKLNEEISEYDEDKDK